MEIEVCVSSIEDVVRAERAGATRIELCTAMEVIGVTPTLSYFKLAKEISNIPILAFIRPRAGGFVYSDLEFEIMKRDVKEFYKAGARTFVFGILTENHKIDINRCRELMKIVGNDSKFVFHKAFDYVDNLNISMNQLIELGFQRVLTSGGIGSTEDNLEVLNDLITQYGKQIEIMPGGGITKDNIQKVIDALDVDSIHLSAKATQEDVIDFVVTDEKHLERVVKIIKKNEKREMRRL